MATTIQSLDRGLQILIILGKEARPLSLNEIAGHFDIDRSSVFRLLGTLASNGFVSQDEETKRYSIGYRVLELSGAFSDQYHIESLIRPIMRRVCDSTRQNTHLAVLDGGEVVFIAVEHPRDAVALNITVGAREPAIHTALGRALLAFLPSEILDGLLASAKFTRHTGRSVTSRTALMQILEKVRETRVAVDDEEFKPGIFCFAAPVFSHRREALYSIGISGSADMIKPWSREYGTLIREAGREASDLLGYSG